MKHYIYSKTLQPSGPVSEEKDLVSHKRAFFTLDYRPLLTDIAFDDFINVVSTALRQLGGALDEIGFYPYGIEVSYRVPGSVDRKTADNYIRRQSSDYYKNNYRGLGASSGRNTLWRKYMVDLSETPEGEGTPIGTISTVVNAQ